MLQNEFEKLIGRKVTTEEYAKANLAYMQTDMDKDAFAKAYDKSDKELVDNLAHSSDFFNRQFKLTYNGFESFKENMLQLAVQANNKAMIDECKAVMSFEKFATILIRMDKTSILSDAEKQRLIEMFAK